MTDELNPRILVVDDDPFIIELLRDFLEAAGFNLTLIEDPVQGLSLAKKESFDVVLLDVMMPKMDGLTFLEALKEDDDSPEVIMITARSDAALVTRAMKAGAFDYIVKPIAIQRLIMATKNALARRALSKPHNDVPPPPPGSVYSDFFVAGNETSRVARQAHLLARYFAFMMVSGPEGVGKGCWVHMLHALSDRSDSPLVTIDCDQIDRATIARELFGHVSREDGSYIPGGLKRADGSILWLRNLETLPEFVQSHLAEYMDSGLLTVPGLPEDDYLDVKIVASTRLDLREDSSKKRFNANFLRRLGILHVELKPLEQRRDEIVPLAEHLLRRISKAQGGPVTRLDSSTLEIFKVYPWAGNVKQMVEFLTHGIGICKQDTLYPHHLPARMQDYSKDLSYQLAKDAADLLK